MRFAPTLRLISFLGLILLLAFAMACSDETDTSGESQERSSEQSGQRGEATPREGSGEPSVAEVPPSQSEGESSVTEQPPSQSEGGPSTGAEATPEPGEPLQPPGYLHGAAYGLALAQTTRRPSVTREGWVDITLSLVAARFEGGGVAVSEGEQESVCLSRDDCISVKWGSTEQNQAALRTAEGAAETYVNSPRRKAMNLQVTFEVAANAAQGSLYFNEHKIPLNLEGDELAAPTHAVRVPAPTPPPSQDPKTANFFMDREHGIAVTNAYRVVDLQGPMALARVELLVLPLGGYDGSLPLEVRPDDPKRGNVCFGNGFTDPWPTWPPQKPALESPDSECLEIWWGEENQFNAILAGYHPAWQRYDGRGGFDYRPLGARWPVPVVVEFSLPRNHHSAVLKFGEHEIPLDLRGMSGDPAFDYTSHFDEASPGSVLYDREGKRVVLDGVEHDPETGDMQLDLTVTNDSEASDFTPVFKTDAIFSARSAVDVGEASSPMSRSVDRHSVTGETLAPGQSGSLQVTVPRSGNDEWGWVAYSDDQDRRPDGALVRAFEDDENGEASASESTGPLFVRFDRREDEEKFWTVRQVLDYGTAGRYLGHHIGRGGGRIFKTRVIVPNWSFPHSIVSIDADSGDVLWGVITGFQSRLSDYLPVLAADEGVLFVHLILDKGRDNRLKILAFDTGTGKLLWETTTDGDYYSHQIMATPELLLDLEAAHVLRAIDPGSGSEKWTHEFDGGVVWHGTGDGLLFMADDVESGGAVYALDAATGSVIRETETSGEVVDFEDGLFAISRGGGGADLVNAATGETKELRYEDGYTAYYPELAEGIVYLDLVKDISVQTTLYRFESYDADTLERLSRREDSHSCWWGREFVLMRGVMFCSSKHDTLAFNRTGENFLWISEGGGPPVTARAGVVYTKDEWGRVAALDAATGELLAEFPKAQLHTSDQGDIYIETQSGYMYTVVVE